jgi:hypothetical protein
MAVQMTLTKRISVKCKSVNSTSFQNVQVTNKQCGHLGETPLSQSFLTVREAANLGLFKDCKVRRIPAAE